MIAGWADESNISPEHQNPTDTNAAAAGESQKQMSADNRQSTQEASKKPGQVHRNPEEEEKHNKA